MSDVTTPAAKPEVAERAEAQMPVTGFPTDTPVNTLTGEQLSAALGQDSLTVGSIATIIALASRIAAALQDVDELRPLAQEALEATRAAAAADVELVRAVVAAFSGTRTGN